MKVNLWNLIENHQSLDILELPEQGEFKIVHTFTLNKITNIQNLQEKIFLYLSKELITDWPQAKRCRFCFNKTTTKEQVDNYVLLECSTCMRIYEYNSSLDTIPLPVPKYQYLWIDKLKPITHSLENITGGIVLPLEEIFQYEELRQKIVLDFQQKLEDLTLNQPLTMYTNQIYEHDVVNLFLYQDFELLLSKMKSDFTIRNKRIYENIFWPNVKEITDFIPDNNTFKELQKQLISEDQIIDNFEKIKPEIVLEKQISKMIIQHNQDNTDEEVLLLEIFHLFVLSKDVPYMSLYISEIDERKHKVFRPFQDSEELKQWLQYKKRGKQLVIKLRYKQHYLTILISKFNGMKIILPFSKADKTNKTILKEIMDDIYKNLNRHNIILPPKTIDNLEFQTIYLDLFKMEMPEEVDINVLGSLAKCLSPYFIVDQVENTLNLFYIMNVDNKEMIRMDKFLWRYIKQQKIKGRVFDSYSDELKIVLGDEFDLEGEQLDFIFRNWMRENAEQLNNKHQTKLHVPIKNGIFIQIVVGEVFRIHIRGIQKWNQIDEIVLFLQKFLTIVLNPPEFFKKQCKGIKSLKSLKPKQQKFSKILKTNFPKLFVDNYTTHCQNERQPLVFKDQIKYENWMKQQIVFKDDIFKINEKEYDSRVFSRKCSGLSKEKLKQYQKELNTTNCIIIQQKIFNMKKSSQQIHNSWKKKELETILQNLGLNTEGHYEDNVVQIKRYFTIQKKILQNKIEDINPYPNTMIIKQNEQNFYLTCPNTSKKANDQKQIFMGFLQLDKHPQSSQALGDDKKQWCVPCCTKKVQGKVKEKLNDFCFGLIDYDEFTNNDNGQSDYILNESKFPLTFGRFGKLDKRLHNLLKSNKVPDNVNEIKQKTFLRLGIPQSNHSFISSVLTSINFENKEKRTIQDVYEYIKQNLTPKVYMSLNNGNLISKQSIETYKTYLDIHEENQIDFQDLWQVLSMPKMLTKFGMNIIIFEKIDKDIYIVCPKDQEIQHFFDSNKPSILIYKQENEFEPIVWFDGNKTHGLVDIETQSIQDWYLNSCRLQNFPEDWTAKSMVSQQTQYQFVNSFNKVIYLIEKNVLLPVLPVSGIIIDLPIKKDYSQYLLSYDETLKQLPNKYIAKNVILNEMNQVYGIIVQYDLVVPIKPEDYDKTKMLSIRTDLDIYDKVNEAILQDIKEYDYSSVNKLYLLKELYERIRYEYSIIQPNKTIDEFFQKNIIVEEISKEQLKQYIVPNIRKLCKEGNNIHCQDGKIRLPQNVVDKFKTKLENEMKYNRQKRREILEKDISPIIDLFRFVDSKNVRFY